MPDYTLSTVQSRVSIVICTDGRSDALAVTLQCLESLIGPAFEVCVVSGPTEDGTDEVLRRWHGRIKTARNLSRNLSASRNIGIAMAVGEVVAFIDDDGLPEPEWLPQILRAFDDPRVAGAGGIVIDHTGSRLQYRYASADRLGNADLERETPADSYSFPFSFNFPYVQGTNSAFRRAALLAIGGFDEEFDFYLDETDVCCRLIDRGWLIRQLPDAFVHHKFLPSAIRTPDRVTRVLYSVLKNKLYFSLVNNHGHYPPQTAINDMMRFVQAREADLRHHVEAGRLAHADLDAFQADVDRAWTVGLERGLSQERKLLPPSLLTHYVAPHLEFPRPRPDGGSETLVFVSKEYPPGRMGGVGRYIHQLARAAAALGHHVRVITPGEEHDRVDFEDGVWVHRFAPRPAPPSPGFAVPPHIWGHAHSVLSVLREIAERRPVTAVYSPIWDCEGVAILVDGTFPLVLGLQTTLHFWLHSHPHHAADEAFRTGFAEPMLSLEARLLRGCHRVHAISTAIARDISDAYDVVLTPPRTRVVPLGLEDWSQHPRIAPKQSPDGTLRLLFAGRLEARKGIDVFLLALQELMPRHPTVQVDVVGNDQIPGPSGTPYRTEFEAAASPDTRARVKFHGRVTDEELRGFYCHCDVFVAPSRFESFGLVLLEAMMFAKPVVACRTGGMVEVAEDGITALLADPGDKISLVRCLERLISNADLRHALGSAGRKRYEAEFTPVAMALGVVSLMRQAQAERTRSLMPLYP